MTLRDLMASHMPALLSTEHFGQDVTVTAKGIAKSFTLRVVVGDQADAYSPDGAAVQQSNQAQMVFQRSAWRTAIGPLTTNANLPRDARRGDTITIPAGLPYAGDWIIAQTTDDEGDGANALLERPEYHQIAGTGAAELR